MQASVRGSALSSGTSSRGGLGRSNCSSGDGAHRERGGSGRDGGVRGDSHVKGGERVVQREGAMAGEEGRGREEEARGRKRASEEFREEERARNGRSRWTR